ncbi:MAG: tape measure protein [Treponemataceae bacterium]
MADKKTLEMIINVKADSAAKTLKAFSNQIKTLSESATHSANGIKADKAIFQNLEKSAKQATASFKLFGKSSAELHDLQSQLKKTALDLATSGFRIESKEVQKLKEQYQELEAQSLKLESEERGLFGIFEKLKTELGSVAVVAAAVKFDKMLGSGIKYALEQADSFRGMKEEFGIMLGDMQAGAGLFNELQKFNFWTPFDMDQISQATKGLMAAKVPLSEITKYLTIFGDLSQGNGQKFQSFINAFNKASAKGKADMEILNVYIDQGVQILDQLGSQMGVTSSEVTKMASNGEISFLQLKNALQTLTAEGGLYHDSMALASQRLSGAYAGLEESVNALASSFGQVLAPAAQKVVEFLTLIIDSINNSPFVKGIFVGLIASVATLINGKLIIALLSLIKTTWAAFAAIMAKNLALSATNVALLAATVAVGVAVTAWVAYSAKQQEAANSTAEHALELKKQTDAVQDLKNAVKELNLVQLKFNISQTESEIKKVQAEIESLRSEKKRALTSELSGINIPVGNMGKSFFSLTEEKLQEAEKNLKNLNDQLKIYKDELGERDFKEALKEGNELLEWRNKLYSQTKEAQREQLLLELEKAKSLRNKQTVNEDGSYSGFDLRKTEAIISMLSKKLEDLDKDVVASLGDEWANKVASNLDKTLKEYEKSQKDLQKRINQLKASGFNNETEFVKEKAALELYYVKKISEAKRKDLDEWNSKFKNILDNLKYQQLESIKNKDLAGAIKSTSSHSVLDSSKNSELGKVIEGAIQGGEIGAIAAIVNAFVNAVSKAISTIENGQKILNFMTTIVEKAFENIKFLLNDLLQPFVDILDALGEAFARYLKLFLPAIALFYKINPIFKVLSFFLQQLAVLFEGLYEIIKPVLKAFIFLYNGLVDLLGRIGIRLKKITMNLDQSQEQIENFTKQQEERVRNFFNRKQDAIKELLNSQLEALKSQYELGLISRDSYEAQAQMYSTAADEKIISLNEQMNARLKEISKNTYASLSGAGKTVQNQQDSRTWYKRLFDPLNLFWHDTGSANIEFDHVAMIHKGETIIPKTFAQGIRSGELSLVGGKKGENSENNQSINVSINVEGSVVSEGQIVDAVYKGISAGINSKKYSPFPGATI